MIPKYWVQNSSAVDTAYSAQSYQRPRRTASTWAPMASAANSMNCEYMRASCEYHTQNGAIVASTAAIQPVRRS